jgi:hypothetical protein
MRFGSPWRSVCRTVRFPGSAARSALERALASLPRLRKRPAGESYGRRREQETGSCAPYREGAAGHPSRSHGADQQQQRRLPEARPSDLRTRLQTQPARRQKRWRCRSDGKHGRPTMKLSVSHPSHRPPGEAKVQPDAVFNNLDRETMPVPLRAADHLSFSHPVI